MTAPWKAPIWSASGRSLEATPVDIIASGGVGTLDDLRATDSPIEADGRGLAGAITGKAIYEGRFTVADGVAVLEGRA